MFNPLGNLYSPIAKRCESLYRLLRLITKLEDICRLPVNGDLWLRWVGFLRTVLAIVATCTKRRAIGDTGLTAIKTLAGVAVAPANTPAVIISRVCRFYTRCFLVSHRIVSDH